MANGREGPELRLPGHPLLSNTRPARATQPPPCSTTVWRCRESVEAGFPLEKKDGKGEPGEQVPAGEGFLSFGH